MQVETEEQVQEQPLKKQCRSSSEEEEEEEKVVLCPETEKINEKLTELSLAARPLWTAFRDCMVLLARNVGGMTFKQKLEKCEDEGEAAVAVADVVVPFLMGHVQGMQPDGGIWASVIKAKKLLTTLLNEMAKYMLAYFIITGKESSHDGEVHPSPGVYNELLSVFCWHTEEMTLLYMVEFINFTMVMKQTRDRWFEKGEAAIFKKWNINLSRIRDFICGEDMQMRSEITGKWQQERVKREGERTREFLTLYPRPAKGTKSEWAASFVEQFRLVAEFERELASYSEEWGNFCRTAVAASNFAEKVEEFTPGSLASALSGGKVANADVIGKLHDFFATYWRNFDSLSKAVKTTMLKEARATSMMRVIYCYLQFYAKDGVPMWIIEYIHRSPSDVLDDLRTSIRGNVRVFLAIEKNAL